MAQRRAKCTVDNGLVQTSHDTEFDKLSVVCRYFARLTARVKTRRRKRNFISLSPGGGGGIKSPDASLTNIPLAVTAVLQAMLHQDSRATFLSRLSLFPATRSRDDCPAGRGKKTREIGVTNARDANDATVPWPLFPGRRKRARIPALVSAYLLPLCSLSLHVNTNH